MNIFLSIPILDRPEYSMIHSTYQAILSCKEHRVRIFTNLNDSWISRVRNVHMSIFINDYPDYDYFCSIDSDIEIVNNLGFSYLKQGNLASAQQTITLALTLSPDRATAWENLGEVFGIKGDVNKAVACFSNALSYWKIIFGVYCPDWQKEHSHEKW